ncbi:MAG: biopolymer transporter ExbD [Candidatus Gastranaerophilales bacterium]|nr:biopolymer transporter ExbD [Candidatus Gastranaerophilales bacterium]
MSFSSSDDKKGLFTEINITPLTDIFLVLLIIMMVIAPSFQSIDTNIEIPEINSGVSIEQKNAEISLTKEGQFYINGKPVEENQLIQELTDLKPSLEKAEVVVKADSAAKSSKIQVIMKAAQEAEYTKLVLAGEPLTKKEQRKLQDSVNEQMPARADNSSLDWDE